MSRPSVFITGAARGIGRACAERFAARGWFVGLYDVEADRLAETARALEQAHGSGAVCHRVLDVRATSSVEAAVAHFGARSQGRMDVLVNNAGVMSVGRFETIDAEAHRRIVAVNLQGVIEVALAAFPLLRDTPGARLINMSSISAVHGVPQMASYSATKHGVGGFTEALRIEWASHDVRVCDVLPAFVDTALLTSTRRLSAEDVLGVRLTPEDVAEVVWQAATASAWRARRVHWPVGPQARLVSSVGALVPDALVALALRRMTKL